MARAPGGAGPWRLLWRRAFPSGRLRFIALTAVTLWLLLSAWQLLLARAEADRARHLLTRARAELDLDSILDGDAARLREAEHLFESAANRAGSAMLAPLRRAPFAGRQIAAFERLARSSGDVVDIGLDGLDEVRETLDGSARGRELEIAGELVATARDVAARLDAVDLGSGDDLIAPLADAHAEVRDELSELRDTIGRAVTSADGVFDLLSGDSRYLLLAANNAEMRAGSGMFLSAGELEIHDGAFELGPMTPTPELFLPPGAVATTGIDDLEDRWGWLHPSQEWRNLNLTPRFDVSGRLAAEMWVAAGGAPVDGVLAVDVVALQALLAATGPVVLDGIRVNADNVVHEVLLEQYRRYPDLVDRDERRDALGRLARAALNGLERDGLDVRTLVRRLAGAIADRHLLAWSPDDDAPLWESVGADGTLDEDSLLVSVLNRGGNKLDQFLDVRSSLELADTEGDRRATLELALRLRPPADLPAYVAGPHPNSGLDAREYGGIVSVNLPAAARDVAVEGGGTVAVAGPDGPSFVVGVPVELAAGSELVIRITFVLPAGAGVHVEPSARVPAVRWTEPT